MADRAIGIIIEGATRLDAQLELHMAVPDTRLGLDIEFPAEAFDRHLFGIGLKVGKRRRATERDHARLCGKIAERQVLGAVRQPTPERGGSARSVPRPLDICADAAEFFLKPLEAPVEMVDAVHHRLAFRHQPGNHK